MEQCSPAWIRMKTVERRIDLDVIEPLIAWHRKQQLERFILVAERRVRRGGARRRWRSPRCSFWSTTPSSIPGPPRGLRSATYTDDFNAVKALGRKTGSTRTDDQTALALFWDGNASIHWNQVANQIAPAHDLSISDASRLFAVLNIAMADTSFTTWSGKRFYGAAPNEVTWRPVTSIPLADTDGNPDTVSDPAWLSLIQARGRRLCPSLGRHATRARSASATAWAQQLPSMSIETP